MENNHDIDKTFNEASKALDEPATFPGFEKVWSKVEEKLDKKESKKRTIPMWIPYGIAASLIIGFGALYFTTDHKETGIPQEPAAVMATHTVLPAPAETKVPEHDIQKIDDVIKTNIEKEIQKPESVKKLAVEKPLPSVYRSPMPEYTAVYAPKADIYREPAMAAHSDTPKEKNMEEVIAMGIKKEKKSILNSSFRMSSNEGHPTNINAVGDTAQSISFDSYDKKGSLAIVGYNRPLAKSKNYTASSTTISGRDLMNSLEGKASGININSGYVNASAKQSVLVRGMSAEKADKDPLYLINGQVSDAVHFKNLDPDKIESIQIFNNENSALTAVYGSRAANGMIVVTTKDITRKQKKAVEKIIRQNSPVKK